MVSVMVSVIDVTSPNTLYSIRERSSLKIFLAGGITGCSDWQRRLIGEIKSNDQIRMPEMVMNFANPQTTLYNPRRTDFNVYDRVMEEEQITWEYEHIEKSDVISFWFAKETIQPITLFELGKAIGLGKHIIIGIDDDYERADDVTIQLKLAGYDGDIDTTIPDLAESIVDYIC